MKIIETGSREIGFVLWCHCQNLLDDPRKRIKQASRKIYLYKHADMVCLKGDSNPNDKYALSERAL